MQSFHTGSHHGHYVNVHQEFHAVWCDFNYWGKESNVLKRYERKICVQIYFLVLVFLCALAAEQNNFPSDYK